MFSESIEIYIKVSKEFYVKINITSEKEEENSTKKKLSKVVNNEKKFHPSIMKGNFWITTNGVVGLFRYMCSNSMRVLSNLWQKGNIFACFSS